MLNFEKASRNMLKNQQTTITELRTLIRDTMNKVKEEKVEAKEEEE